MTLRCETFDTGRIRMIRIVSLKNEVFQNLRPKFEVTLTYSEVKNISLVMIHYSSFRLHRCWWRFWPCWSPTSTIIHYSSIGHQDTKDVTNIHKSSPTLSPRHNDVTNITVPHFFRWSPALITSWNSISIFHSTHWFFIFVRRDKNNNFVPLNWKNSQIG